MRILIAEDDATSRRILEATLKKWGHDVISAVDGNEAWEKLQGYDAPKLAVLDWMMPGMEGDEICRRYRESIDNEDLYTYFILLTSKGSKIDIVSGMDAGADDYVVKPFNQNELRVRVRAGQRIVELHSKLLAAKQELFRQAQTDPLTGILNRRAVMAVIDKEISRAKRTEKKLTLSMLDIDHFKKINDTYGHMMGDEVLREITKRIDANIRIYDSIGRFGGEEFLIVIPGAESADAYTIGETICSIIADTDVVVNGSSIRVTASQGIVTSDGKASVDELIVSADKALYQAKGKGRNRFEQALI